MNLTIGMSSYGNPIELWFTLQSLRIYHDIEDTEILVIDNEGNDKIKKVVKDCRCEYVLYTEKRGTGPARNHVFKVAQGDFVLVIDSHVLFWPDAIYRLKRWVKDNWEDAKNLIHGPLIMSGLNTYFTHYDNQWRAEMWGIWPEAKKEEDIGVRPLEIEMMGCGVFGCRRDSWLGFHPDCIGFGGVEGVIHEKYRKHGRKVLSLPFLKWVHFFGASHTYPIIRDEKIRNFLLGFAEIGLDPTPVYEHFGKEKVKQIAETIWPGMATE